MISDIRSSDSGLGDVGEISDVSDIIRLCPQRLRWRGLHLESFIGSLKVDALPPRGVGR